MLSGSPANQNQDQLCELCLLYRTDHNALVRDVYLSVWSREQYKVWSLSCWVRWRTTGNRQEFSFSLSVKQRFVGFVNKYRGCYLDLKHAARRLVALRERKPSFSFGKRREKWNMLSAAAAAETTVDQLCWMETAFIICEVHNRLILMHASPRPCVCLHREYVSVFLCHWWVEDLWVLSCWSDQTRCLKTSAHDSPDERFSVLSFILQS